MLSEEFRNNVCIDSLEGGGQFFRFQVLHIFELSGHMRLLGLVQSDAFEA